MIGHRGAAAYAPEHTLLSYDLALQQGADAVEQDLHVTKDGILVCLHDRSLARTTNASDRFPDRAPWFVHDFTLDEIKQLDAGSWFGARFADLRIATFDEVIDCVGTRGTLLVELKDPDVYAALGIDLLSMFAKAARSNMTLQCFHEPTVRRAGAMFDRRVPVVLLVEPAELEEWSNRDRVQGVAEYAAGIGPGKDMLDARPDIVQWAHDAGLSVTPWTFRAAAPGRFPTVRDEMEYHLSVLGVDGVITDNPDEVRRSQSSR
ncbi:MAG TPA: glycerophosphodiester phosphodiesterase family protein [Vicinamibacterales bacterium]|nr:glycerophosphodiester phosphodiesterase family protein [Vicinamibacterales bacterium]